MHFNIFILQFSAYWIGFPSLEKEWITWTSLIPQHYNQLTDQTKIQPRKYRAFPDSSIIEYIGSMEIWSLATNSFVPVHCSKGGAKLCQRNMCSPAEPLPRGHWCIKSIYNGFAIAINCTLKVVPFGFCFVQVMPLFRISFCLHRRGDKKSAWSSLRLFGDLGIIEANLYPS